MNRLSPEIEKVFYETLRDHISAETFEQWLYSNKELEKLLKADDYLDLISLNYAKGGAKYELWSLLRKHIDPGAYETYKMLLLLEETVKKTDKLYDLLTEYYSLYCNGYQFLENIALSYSLEVEALWHNNVPVEWDELTREQQQHILNEFPPGLEEEAEQIMDWLISKKIVLTGAQNESKAYLYEDFRTDSEKTFRPRVRASKTKWWQFWKR